MMRKVTYIPKSRFFEDDADTLTFLERAESVGVSFTTSEGELLALLPLTVVIPLLEPPNAGTVILWHGTNVLKKE